MELLAVLWFFGIHNAVLQGPLGAISMTMVVGNSKNGYKKRRK
ncbi:hypothetical protein [Enterococcus faecium]|nr:hypothetical protein [Enterococcus faecium]